MRQVYTVIDKLNEKLKENGITNTVTFGDILEVDLDKTTIYPLSHISMGDVVFSDRIITATIQLFCLDVVDKSNELTDEESIYGNDNLQDVLNTQLQVVNDVQQELRRGDLFSDRLQLTTDITASPFLDNFENQLAGWAATISIEMPNTEHTIC
tara:strand:- start:406 stop:867 length:462 start_codon:yes stop_codon:yes gene_type:complete